MARSKSNYKSKQHSAIVYLDYSFGDRILAESQGEIDFIQWESIQTQTNLFDLLAESNV